MRNYPVNWINKKDSAVRKDLRSINENSLKMTGNSNVQASTFYIDAARVWNLAPDVIKNCKSLLSAKSEIKPFVKTLPL